MFKVREDKNLQVPTQTAKPQFKNFHGSWKKASELWINSEPRREGRKQDSLWMADHPKYRRKQTRGISHMGL